MARQCNPMIRRINSPCAIPFNAPTGRLQKNRSTLLCAALTLAVIFAWPHTAWCIDNGTPVDSITQYGTIVRIGRFGPDGFGTGTGTLIRIPGMERGYGVLTAAHVVGRNAPVTVQLEFLSTTRNLTGLGVLFPDAKGLLDLGVDPNILGPVDAALVLIDEFNGPEVTFGEVSGAPVSLTEVKVYGFGGPSDVLTTSRFSVVDAGVEGMLGLGNSGPARIYPGDSGGPLVNVNGDGRISAVMSFENTTGFAYGTPIDGSSPEVNAFVRGASINSIQSAGAYQDPDSGGGWSHQWYLGHNPTSSEAAYINFAPLPVGKRTVYLAGSGGLPIPNPDQVALDGIYVNNAQFYMGASPGEGDLDLRKVTVTLSGGGLVVGKEGDVVLYGSRLETPIVDVAGSFRLAAAREFGVGPIVRPELAASYMRVGGVMGLNGVSGTATTGQVDLGGFMNIDPGIVRSAFSSTTVPGYMRFSDALTNQGTINIGAVAEVQEFVNDGLTMLREGVNGAAGGTLNVNNIASIGDVGHGELDVRAAATASANFLLAGYENLATGYVQVHGANARLNVNGAWIGAYGHGDLHVYDGGRATISGDSLFAGYYESAEGMIRVDGANSIVESTQATAWIGRSGQGTLRVMNGGLFKSSGALSPSGTSLGIALNEGSSGTVVVQGGGSRIIEDGIISVGFRGDAELQILDGAFVESAGGHIGRVSTADGFVEIAGNGSRWQLNSKLGVGGTATAAGGTGTLIVGAGGTMETTQGVKIWSGGTVGGSGTIVGDVESLGMIAPGESPGLLTIQGSLSQLLGGELQFEVGGSTPGVSYDQLLITDNASLLGLVTIRLIDNFLPQVGDRFDLLLVGGTLDAHNAEFHWLGAPAQFAAAGSFENGIYSFTVTAVPEPSTWLLALVGAMGLATRARRLRR